MSPERFSGLAVTEDKHSIWTKAGEQVPIKDFSEKIQERLAKITYVPVKASPTQTTMTLPKK
jgi:hypothetical protein